MGSFLDDKYYRLHLSIGILSNLTFFSFVKTIRWQRVNTHVQ